MSQSITQFIRVSDLEDVNIFPFSLEIENISSTIYL